MKSIIAFYNADVSFMAFIHDVDLYRLGIEI